MRTQAARTSPVTAEERGIEETTEKEVGWREERKKGEERGRKLEGQQG